MSLSEQKRLESIQAQALYAHGVNTDAVQYCFSIFKRHIKGGSVLEMGPAEGVMTDLLVQLGLDMTVLEGARGFCEDLKRRHPSITVCHSLFEEFAPERKFDNIVLGHVLEHVSDPVDILSRAKEWLTPEGRVLAAVPNSRSLHRQAAVLMGMLDFEEELNEADRHHGHRRVYNPETFRHDFMQSGLNIEIFGGYWTKPLSNKQIEDTWTPEMLEAFMKLGERYPDIAGEIYVVAGPPG